ncbi:MAG: MBL fold metallo-hydrolase [Sphingobacteriales bacterium JAD_PAG50586_3]|nr:MAG: MBL fold metallo-hydrolase [Sphingobacteriales bacterium JAD_PAG50586_3]
MEIEFVNHSSYIVSANNIKLITDPWIDGYAFYNGWALITPTKFRYTDFKSITHIWFSHEHPDHFSPPNINSIPLEYRQNITVLYQYTKDKKVVDFCRNAGFKQVIELKANWYELAPGFSLYNKPHTDGDSWLALKVNGKTILNVNDCVFDTIAELADVKKFALW